jgi:hypothetical protein
MAILAVVRIYDDELVSTIMAELTDPCPEGCYFVELPPDHTWAKGKIVPYSIVNGSMRQTEEF